MKKDLFLYLMDFSRKALAMNMTGITSEESLSVAGDTGKSINWILGHITVSRNLISQLLGLEPLCSKEMVALYDRGTKEPAALSQWSTEKILNQLDEIQNELEVSLNHRSDSDFEAKHWNELFFLYGHEMYHVGQIGLIRRLLGKSGAIS